MNKAIPRWLVLQEKIDYNLFLLGQIYKDITLKSPIDKMIDQATGFDKEQLKEAKKLMKRIDRLKAEYYKVIEKEA